ncbi:MAG TPA: PadR family transcriptional regulator [Candidatus Binatus sp.]|nr:PadR family transcriptional regulator [Candidatus Binatus sp.]
MKKAGIDRASRNGVRGARRGRNGAGAPPEGEERGEARRIVPFHPYVKASLDLALLGLIAEAPEVSGYDIVKIFDLSMEHYWHAHPTQIYPTLERMEKLGIIKSRKVAQSNRPSKWVYTINPSGERLLIEWLESGFEGINLKHPPLLRCRFLGNLGPDGAIAALNEEAEAWARHLRVYRKIEQDYFAGGRSYRNVNAMFSWFTLKRGIDWMKENIAWCEWAIAEIQKNRALFPRENMKTGLKPIIPFDPVKYRRLANEELAAGMRRYNRRKERERAAQGARK